jgi:hypothetical protein
MVMVTIHTAYAYAHEAGQANGKLAVVVPMLATHHYAIDGFDIEMLREALTENRAGGLAYADLEHHYKHCPNMGALTA